MLSSPSLPSTLLTPMLNRWPAGHLFQIAKGKRDDPLPLQLVGDLTKLVYGLGHLGHEVLVVEDDYLLDLVRDPVYGAIVGGALLCPLVDAPAPLLVGVLQRKQQPSFGQHATETRPRVVSEDVWRVVGSQPRLYDIAHLIRIYCLALQDVLWVLLLEPIDLYLCYRSLLSGRLFGPGKEPDNFLITTQQVPAATRST